MKRVIPALITISLLIPLAAQPQDSSKKTLGDLIQVIRILPREEKALVKTPEGNLQIIKSGDVIGEGKRISEIAGGRVVIEERTATGIEIIIVRINHGRQTVERIRRIESEQLMLLGP